MIDDEIVWGPHDIVRYGKGDFAQIFLRRCWCGRFVKPEETADINEDHAGHAYGKCSKHGRVPMPWLCWDCEE